MSFISIQGGRQLAGTITVNGSKNAALPLLAASLLSKETINLLNIPDITDVNHLLSIIKATGATVDKQGNNISVTAKKINDDLIPLDLIGKLRGSILLMGALLGRQKKVRLPEPGGDVIGARPIDVHIDAFQQLGVRIRNINKTIYADGTAMKAGKVILREFSVTATENVMLAAASLPSSTVIHIAANEPHIVALARLLTRMGAKVKGAGTHTITVQGTKHFHGANLTNIPDMLEGGLFILLAAATNSSLTIKKVPVADLLLFFKKLDDIGVTYQIDGDTVHIKPSKLKPFFVQTMPHPGIATDLQAPFAVMATQAHGTSLIHDPMYENRFRHCDELVKMGATVTVCDPHRVVIQGPTKLHGRPINSLDIRSGATLIMAGLVADGETTIQDAQIIERGYANLVERLQQIGANIKKLN